MCMALLGERIRERRQELKLTQTELEAMARRIVEETGWCEAWDAYELLRKSRYVIGEANLPAGLQAMRLPGARFFVAVRQNGELITESRKNRKELSLLA